MSVSYFKTSTQASFTAAPEAVGPVEWIMPFPGQNARVYFRQRYQQESASWTAAALDTAHSVNTTYLLVAESDFVDIGGGQHQWNRYYACTPPTLTDYRSYAGTFPGVKRSATTSGRDPIAAVSQAKITTSFFLVGTLPSLANSSQVTFSSGFRAPLLSDVYLVPSSYIFESSTPSADNYIASIATDAATASSFSVTAEPQTVSRWVGNFYSRTTVNVKAV